MFLAQCVEPFSTPPYYIDHPLFWNLTVTLFKRFKNRNKHLNPAGDVFQLILVSQMVVGWGVAGGNFAALLHRLQRTQIGDPNESEKQLNSI